MNKMALLEFIGMHPLPSRVSCDYSINVFACTRVFGHKNIKGVPCVLNANQNENLLTCVTFFLHTAVCSEFIFYSHQRKVSCLHLNNITSQIAV